MLADIIIVANAGVAGPKAEPDSSKASELKDKLWQNEDFEQWNSTFNTNVSSVYFTTVAFLPLLQAGTETHGSRTASVIVISSMSGLMRHSQGHFSYNAAKGATVHLAKLMSAEFEKTEVRVNSIAPGYFPSEMTAKESGDDQKSDLPEKKVQEIKGHTPAQRPGSDEEMAQAVASNSVLDEETIWANSYFKKIFLARNTYVNGEIIAVDGGTLNEVPGR